jgi:hypothetical protein
MLAPQIVSKIKPILAWSEKLWSYNDLALKKAESFWLAAF